MNTLKLTYMFYATLGLLQPVWGCMVVSHNRLQLDLTSNTSQQKINLPTNQKGYNKSATTDGESRSSGYIFCDRFLISYFLKQVNAWPYQKYTQKIWICLVEYSSSEVLGPSEVPWFVGKLFF